VLLVEGGLDIGLASQADAEVDIAATATIDTKSVVFSILDVSHFPKTYEH
jgi:hypothetical protein